MKTNNKQQNLLALRKEKEKKKELLSGWSQDKETLLQDDIGIESWFMDDCSSDDDDNKDRHYKCALVESLERRERRKRLLQERTKSIQTPNSASNQNQYTNSQPAYCESSTADQEDPLKSLYYEPLRNREPTLSSKSSASLTLLSEKSSDSISSSVGHVALSQSGPSDDTRSDTKWGFHSKDLAPRKLDSFSTSNDSPIVTLLRYEERLKNRRENRLNKRFGDVFRQVEKSDSISPKTPVTMASVCFPQAMIQPMSKTAKKCRYNPRAKLPSLEKKNKNNAETSKLRKEERNESVQSGDAQECRGYKKHTNAIIRDPNSKKEESDTMNENETFTETGNKTMTINERKFNFDVLENYALVRNARRDSNFTDYVKMIRKFQSLPGQSSEKQFGTGEGKGLNFRTTLRRRNSSENLSFDTVRALWHEAQRSRLATHALSERLSLNAKEMGSVLMLDVDPRSRSSSEPIRKNAARNNENEAFSCSQKGKFHSGKYTCPLQRIIAVTNKRIQANDVFLNQAKNSKHFKISREEEIRENKRVGITKSKKGIHCYIVGRTTPATEDSSMER